jgi:hypothetical protein
MLQRVSFCLVALLTVGTVSSSSQSTTSQKIDVTSLSWIAGCWVMESGNRRTEEFWMKPAGQTMIGVGRTIAGGRTVSTEYLQINEGKSGVAYIVALGMGAKPVAFPLLKSTESEVVFENPTHDFPQRIIYRSEGKDALFARIEGQEKGVNKGIDFRYKRATCN